MGTLRGGWAIRPAVAPPRPSPARRAMRPGQPEAAPLRAPDGRPRPLLSFAVATDVQYADIDNGFSFGGVPRFYRHSLEALRRAVAAWNAAGDLAFAVHLGDIVDGFCPRERSHSAVQAVGPDRLPLFALQLKSSRRTAQQTCMLCSQDPVIDKLDRSGRCWKSFEDFKGDLCITCSASPPQLAPALLCANTMMGCTSKVDLSFMCQSYLLKSPSKMHLFWAGNHCLYNLPRMELVKLLGIPPGEEPGQAFYQFSPHPAFRFVVLDGYDVSLLGWPPAHPHAVEAERLLSLRNPNTDKNSPDGLIGPARRFVKFGGGVGARQLAWLDSVLQESAAAGSKVIVLGHLPMEEKATSPATLLWNYEEVMEVVQRYGCVVACFAGHAHAGGYAVDAAGIHHRVLEAVLECPPGRSAYGRVDVYEGALVLTGVDRMASTSMHFTAAAPTAATDSLGRQ
eukprot:SM000186S04126  [mRNA]  locus=s186:56909:59284:- [translate_table: standard]